MTSKTDTVGLRLSRVEIERLERLARQEGLERCAYLRVLLARAESLLPPARPQ